MKLTDKQKAVISVVSSLPDASAEECAQRAGMKVATFRYQLKQLLDSGALSLEFIFNQFRLGLPEHYIFVSLAPCSDSEGFVEAVLAREGVEWFCELGGDFQFGFSVKVTSIGQLEHFLEDLSNDEKWVFTKKSIAIQTALCYMNTDFEGRVENRVVLARQSHHDAPVSIDELDHEILKIVGNRVATSAREVSRILGKPTASIQYRFRQLRENGILLSPYYRLHADRMGLKRHLFFVGTKSVDRSRWEAIIEFARKEPSVYNVARLVGSWDYQFTADLDEASQVSNLKRGLYDLLGDDITSIVTLPEYRRLKKSYYPFESFPFAD